MINLLEPSAKRDLRAARANVILARYCIAVGAAVICVALLVVFSNWWLDNKISIASTQEASNAAATSSYNSVRSQAATFSANLAKIQSVLGNRTHYSTALLNIAASLPTGASLDSVTLSPTFATTPLKITATTNTNSAALALKEKLSQSKIYSKVTIDSVDCGSGTTPGCVVSMTATINQATIFVAGAAE